MANNSANNLTETFQNIFLAGVGALSIGGEKAKAVIDDLVERGQVTVDQGRKINEELKHKAEEGAGKLREESIRAYVRSLSPEERVAFAEQMAQIAPARPIPAMSSSTPTAPTEATTSTRVTTSRTNSDSCRRAVTTCSSASSTRHRASVRKSSSG